MGISGGGVSLVPKGRGYSLRRRQCPLSLSESGFPRGHRTVARAWRGYGAGVARATGHFWLGWRGRGAGMARAWRGHVL
eukprot:gene13605-biopygen3525